MSFLRRLRYLFRRRDLEVEMAEEMRFHLEQRAADYAADGLSAAEAHAAAQRRFGNLGSLQEQAREARGWGWLERAAKDLRLAGRNLARSPGFAILAIVTLALGIGVNTAMFSVLDGIMLKPLPYADSEGLDRLYRATPQDPRGNFSAADYFDLRRASEGYGRIAAYTIENTSLAEPGHPADLVDALRVSTNFLSTLGVRPQLGRDFLPAEERDGNDRVALLSQRCWQQRFNGRADIVGRTIRIDGEPHQIVGVLPASFNDWRHLGWVDVFRPLAFSPAAAADRKATAVRLLGRRDPARSRADANRFLAAFGARLASEYPEHNAGSTWLALPLSEVVAGASGPATLAMLVGLSGFVLLIACSNLANLLLARAIARAREFAVRAALGASRLQLLRPVIAEALLLAAAGGTGAIIVALWVFDWLAVRSTADNGEQVNFHLDGRVLAWALGASLVTALAFGAAPALFALRMDPQDTLKSGGRGATGSRGQQRFRRLLIVGQFALAMVLLAGAALFIRGLDELNHRRAGWESAQLVTGDLVLPAAAYPDEERIRVFHRLALERLEALPGVAAAGVSTFTPFFDWPDVRRFVVQGQATPARGHEPAATVNRVSPHYFAAVATPLLAGRAFDRRDSATAPRVFVINATLARDLFGRADPIGRRLAFAGEDAPRWGEIVGVVADVKSVMPDAAPVAFQLYVPLAQEPAAAVALSVRSASGDPSPLVEGIRQTLTALDPDLPIRHLNPADTAIKQANYQLAVLRDMLTGFGVLGLALACLGIYGVIARTIAQRTSEFAIRIALGATLGGITRGVLAQGVRLALTGAALGALGACGIARLIAAGYSGMHFEQLPALAATALLLVGVALLASWLPARRATKVDPMLALRAE